MMPEKDILMLLILIVTNAQLLVINLADQIVIGHPQQLDLLIQTINYRVKQDIE